MPKAKKLPSGNWRTRIYIGTENGKPKYKSFTADTKKESEYKAIQFSMQTRKKTNLEIQKSFVPVIVNDYIDANSSILSPSTIRGYITLYKNQIKILEGVTVNNFDAVTH